MPTPLPTIDELIATLKRSSLPTVIVEGKYDIEVYRWVEERMGVSKASFLPCNGRTALLEIYERRSEFSQIPTAYIADRDMWLFTSIPDNYAGIIWTDGYSIENDLYAGASLENLLDPAEKIEHSKVLSSIIEWFAFEVEEYRNSGVCQANRHSREVVPLKSTSISPEFIASRGFKSPSDGTIKEISDNYKLKVRGKTLFQLLIRYFSDPNRFAVHNTNALYEIAFKGQNQHTYMERIISQVEDSLLSQSRGVPST